MRIGRPFHTAGLLLGTFLFALSLTPTLLPRTDVVQGIISGLSFTAGYGLGVFAHWLWRYLELPVPHERNQRILQGIAAGICGLIAVSFLWRAGGWQNSVRALMEMEPAGGVHPVTVGLVAIIVFLGLWLLAKLFRRLFLALSRRMQRFVPRRVSHVFGLVAAFVLFWAIIDGILFSLALRSADASYQQVDALLEAEYDKPTDAMRAGSRESLLDWDDMGRHGRRFLSRGLTTEELEAFSEDTPREPVRVYVGLNAADTAEERAELALAELKRLDAFDRSLLVLVTPTGTGWVDQASMTPLEYLHHGDVATVAAQYSYLPSHLSLMVEGEYGVEMAQAMFEKIYGHWSELPEEERPRLYLHGLSLGALNSDRSFDFFDIIDDPFHGALWSGPPFRKETWRTVTERRQADSPAWLPRFRDDSVVRFANQHGGLETGAAEWGSFRIAYLQYASDPVTFFEPEAFYRKPEWMEAPRGPDVSEHLRWYPIVTGLQLAADMAAGSSPRGFGHDFAAEHYLDAWHALTEPEGWDEDALDRLREVLREDE